MITEKIHEFNHDMNGIARQGDVALRPIDVIPNDAVLQKTDSDHVIAHSETGHHHVLSSKTVNFFLSPSDPMLGFIDVLDPTVLEHQRDFHTHESIRVGKGAYEIRRQRESAPEGWRRAAD